MWLLTYLIREDIYIFSPVLIGNFSQNIAREKQGISFAVKEFVDFPH